MNSESALNRLDKLELSPHREKTLQVAILLAVTGGYLDAFTWLVHGVLANAQSANVVLLGVFLAARKWTQAFHYVPPIAAFVFGIFVSHSLRRRAGQKAGQISILVEAMMLTIVLVLHASLPDVAGTLGISFTAALQTASFPKVEGWAYSSVMATGNLRQSVEALFEALAGRHDPVLFRQAYVFGALCVAFGLGAALGACVTERLPAIALVIPVTLLLIVLWRCSMT
jgi:uncharacterized membrane protein YoaK (UPF0700 family)